ncbi:MAG: hypothetical protein ABJA61_04170 [Caldimonas sp.]
MTKRDRRPRVRTRAAAALLAGAALQACSPALDWRESRPEGSGVVMMFPCRPVRYERTVQLAGQSTPMQLHSCRAADNTFSLAVADASDPARVAPLLAALREQAVGNIAGVAAPRPLPPIAGATPNAASALWRIEGKRPDGRRVVEHAAFFVKGLRLYQATVIGEAEPPGQEWFESFFAAIRVP